MSDQASFVFDSFNSVSVNGNGGDDVANLVGTDGRDEFLLGPNTGVRNNDQGSVRVDGFDRINAIASSCLLYTSPSPRDKRQSRMPSSA